MPSVSRLWTTRFTWTTPGTTQCCQNWRYQGKVPRLKNFLSSLSMAQTSMIKTTGDGRDINLSMPVWTPWITSWLESRQEYPRNLGKRINFKRAFSWFWPPRDRKIAAPPEKFSILFWLILLNQEYLDEFFKAKYLTLMYPHFWILSTIAMKILDLVLIDFTIFKKSVHKLTNKTRNLTLSPPCFHFQRYRKEILLKLFNTTKVNPDNLNEEEKAKAKRLDQKISDMVKTKPIDVFQGRTECVHECQDCKHRTRKIEVFMDLSLPVLSEKVFPLLESSLSLKFHSNPHRF